MDLKVQNSVFLYVLYAVAITLPNQHLPYFWSHNNN